MSSPAEDYIHRLYPSCVTYARDVLGWPVFRSGQRTQSLHPGVHRHKNLVVYDDFWYDHKEKVGGDVIALCAWARHGGDRGKAMRELAGDFYEVKARAWTEKIERIKFDVSRWHQELRQADRDYLHSRRISDETIERLQIGYRNHRLMIPYLDASGRAVFWAGRETLSYEREELRRRAEAGEEIPTAVLYGKTSGDPKYLYDRIQENADYGYCRIPWGMHTQGRAVQAGAFIDKNKWLVVCEGLFDGISFEQEGFKVACSGGGSFGHYANRLVADWARDVGSAFIIYDSDSAGSRFQKDMAMKFFEAGVPFFFGELPDEENGRKVKDVSDYYAAGGDLEELVVNAKPGIPALASMIDSPDEFKGFILRCGRFCDRPALLELFDLVHRKFSPLWLKAVRDLALKCPAESVTVKEILNKHRIVYLEGGGFFMYEHGVWNPTPENSIRALAGESLGLHATSIKMLGVARHIQAVASVKTEFNTQSLLNFRNGVLLPDEGLRFAEHNEDFMSSIQLKYSYDPEADCPLWREFIAGVTEGRKDKQLLLQEIGGYPIVTENQKYEKAVFLKGDGGNGKGVFIDILTQVYGEENCSAVEPSKFDSPFDPIMLRYSLVNLCAESKTDMRQSEAKFKGIVSGDYITASHKGVDAVKFRPRCKIITSCNDFMNSSDITHGFLRKCLFVLFNVNYEQQKKQDIHLREKLMKEIPGIMNWCIEGYLRLKEQGHFTETEEQETVKAEFMEMINPAVSFIKEKLIMLYGVSMDAKELYSDYSAWAKNSGCGVMSQNKMTRTLKTLLRTMRPDVQVVSGSRNVTKFVFPDSPFADMEAE